MSHFWLVLGFWAVCHAVQFVLVFRCSRESGRATKNLAFSAAGSLPSAFWLVMLTLIHLSEPSRALLGGYVLVWVLSLGLVPIGGLLALGAALLPPYSRAGREQFVARLLAVLAVGIGLYALTEFNPRV